ncbi:MAG: hypothetical protein ACXWF8_10165 [Methylobacter sp.]
MNAIIKSTITACGMLAAATVPLAAQADTTGFTNKGAFGAIGGSNGWLSLNVVAAENTTLNTKTDHSSSSKSTPAGAYFSGSYFSPTECWFGFGFASTLQFQTSGDLPNKLSASGTIPVTWYEYCSGSDSVVTDTITFNQDLTALRTKASPAWGNTHYEYGNTQVNDRFDYSSAPASANASSLSSQNMGAVTLNYSQVGRSNSHEVQITQ